MTQTPKGAETLSAKMSTKELASYEWRGMGNKEGRALFEGSESIKVTVGTESNQKTWYLPKKVLTHCSPYFDAALNGNFVEASSKTVDLPEDDPVAFEMWATWLSLGKCNYSNDDEEFDSDLDSAYVRAWMLGEKFACPAFKDHVMFCLLIWLENFILESDLIRFVYGDPSPGSKLRRFCVDAFVWYKLEGALTQDADKSVALLREVPEFSDDVVRREVMAGRTITRSPFEEQHRYYENPAFKPDA